MYFTWLSFYFNSCLGTVFHQLMVFLCLKSLHVHIAIEHSNVVCEILSISRYDSQFKH